MGFTRIFEKNGETKCEHWSENELTSFVENAITSIFAKGGDSLGFSKKLVKKTAKIGQKMNSVSYLDYDYHCGGGDEKPRSIANGKRAAADGQRGE